MGDRAERREQPVLDGHCRKVRVRLGAVGGERWARTSDDLGEDVIRDGEAGAMGMLFKDNGVSNGHESTQRLRDEPDAS